MGTIAYGNLVELLLEEGNKNKEEIIKEAKDRFGFPEDSLSFGVGLQLGIGERIGFFSKSSDDRYLLLKYDEGIFSRKNFLKNLDKASEDYLKERPWILKLKLALEEAELKNEK